MSTASRSTDRRWPQVFGFPDLLQTAGGAIWERWEPMGAKSFAFQTHQDTKQNKIRYIGLGISYIVHRIHRCQFFLICLLHLLVDFLPWPRDYNDLTGQINQMASRVNHHSFFSESVRFCKFICRKNTIQS